MNDLEGIGVLVTRPLPQGKMLCEKIEALGGSTVYLPTIEFAPPKPRVSCINKIDAYDWVIFISPRAVEWGIPLMTQLPQKNNVAAPGAGTAQALKEAGINKVIYPKDEWTSEGLLDLPIFKNLKQQKILLIRGEGGREMLAETLTSRGAVVDHFIVYRRLIPVYPNINKYKESLLDKKTNIIVCTSGESLHNLITIMGVENRSILVSMNMVVISPRLVELAKGLHFQQIFLAENASDSAIIGTLRLIKEKGYVK